MLLLLLLLLLLLMLMLSCPGLALRLPRPQWSILTKSTPQLASVFASWRKVSELACLAKGRKERRSKSEGAGAAQSAHLLVVAVRARAATLAGLGPHARVDAELEVLLVNIVGERGEAARKLRLVGHQMPCKCKHLR